MNIKATVVVTKKNTFSSEITKVEYYEYSLLPQYEKELDDMLAKPNKDYYFFSKVEDAKEKYEELKRLK